LVDSEVFARDKSFDPLQGLLRAMTTTKGRNQSSVPLNFFRYCPVHPELKPPESNAAKIASRVAAGRMTFAPLPIY